MSKYLYRDKMLSNIYYEMRKVGQWMTRKEICDAVGRAKTPEMIELIDSLVDAGLLLRKQYFLKNGKLIFFYLAKD